MKIIIQCYILTLLSLNLGLYYKFSHLLMDATLPEYLLASLFALVPVFIQRGLFSEQLLSYSKFMTVVGLLYGSLFYFICALNIGMESKFGLIVIASIAPLFITCEFNRILFNSHYELRQPKISRLSKL